MKLSVSWPNSAHFLLQNPTVTLVVDGSAVAGTMRSDGADFKVPIGTVNPSTATLTVKFAPNVTGSPAETLRVVQHFVLSSPLLFGGGGAFPFSFTVRPTGASADVTLLGQHPLLSQISALGLWHVAINTNTVDVTTVQPLLLDVLNVLSRPTPRANVRVLARTDGKFPLHWVTATPASSTAFADTDVLCFLTAPQKSPTDSDDPAALIAGPQFIFYKALLGIFLGAGLHNNSVTARARDHFARANDPTDAEWLNMPHPNVVLARGWETALTASGKHVTLAMPIPSGSSHNAAATAKLPALLSDVHAALVAVGDIAAPDGSVMNRRPQLGIAAHSNGGPALFSAVAASPSAFVEIWLFDTQDSVPNVPMLARTKAARVLFAGFDAGRVVAAHAVASGMLSMSGRIDRLPKPAPPNNATPAQLAASSPFLRHALEAQGVANPASTWNPGVVPLPNGEKFFERFETLHQQIVQGKDGDDRHYLTKALASSIFR